MEKPLIPQSLKETIHHALALWHNKERPVYGVLPIWPKFAHMIYEGGKKFEYRKRKPRDGVTTFLLYETRPLSCITGVINISHVISGAPKHIWKETNVFSGLDERSFFSYFSRTEQANAWAISHSVKLSKPISLSDINITTPQTVRYIS